MRSPGRRDALRAAAVTGWDAVWTGARLATMARDAGSDDPWGTVPDGAVAVAGGRIARVGPRDELLGDPRAAEAHVHDVGGGWITPGLIDCHTHLVFAGDRADEFERRLRGQSYEEIAREGGGILSTVRATRAAGEDELFRTAAARVRGLIRDGVTTVEVKSGYGLELETELAMLRVARRLGRELPVTVRTTLLGAHALPPEYEGDREGYLELVTDEMLPRATSEGLADAVDAFCEGIAFTVEECRRVLERGRELGLDARLHADQLSDAGGAALAAELGARSGDHLEHAAPEGIEAMARTGTAAVLLPGAYHYLGGEPPPVDALREAGVPIAVATDLNPGTSPVTSLVLALNLACVHFGLSPAESVAGATREAARVLGLEGERGEIRRGAAADLALWDVDHPRELVYWAGRDSCVGVVKEGERVVP